MGKAELTDKFKNQVENILKHDAKRKLLVYELLKTKDRIDPELVYVKIQNMLIKLDDFEDAKDIVNEQFLNLDD